MDGVDLRALDALLAKATPGPWFRDGSCMYVPSGDTHIADADRHADAALIVAAVNALPALIAHCRELEQDAARYRELLYAVEQKFPGESRHETALRYITQRERGGTESGVDAARAADNAEPKP